MMSPWQIGITLFCGIAIAQSFFLGIYLFLRFRSQSKEALFLSFLLWALALRIGKSFFFYILPEVPLWGVALGAAGLWAVGPSLWLYTKASKPGKIATGDFLHFFPSLFFLGGAWFLDISQLVLAYHAGSLLLMAYLMASLVLFRQEKWQGHHKRFRLFWGGIAIIGLTFIFQMWVQGIEAYALGSAVAAMVLYGLTFFILQDPSLLKAAHKRSKKTPEGELTLLAQRIEGIFAERKLYRQKGLTIAAVASAIQEPAYLISQAIRQEHDMNFNGFVNSYRVKEVKTHLADLQANQKIEVIAAEVGFSSTASLYQAFKKETQVTPHVYRKGLSHSI